jgi:hypothetical protein
LGVTFGAAFVEVGAIDWVMATDEGSAADVFSAEAFTTGVSVGSSASCKTQVLMPIAFK